MQNNTIALAGQPNCGKSTLFNLLTGARQYVANYPGVTVEKLSGSVAINKEKVTVVDLPGTYAFTSYSPEEMAARDFILNENPGVVIAVVDSSTLQKGLYFVLQLLEMERPAILVLNMMDVATRRGMKIDKDILSKELGIPVIAMQATTSKGTSRQDLLNLIAEEIKSIDYSSEFKLDYAELEPAIADLSKDIEKVSQELSYPKRWLAIKLLEEDNAVQALLEKQESTPAELNTLVQKYEDDVQEKHALSTIAQISALRHKEARRISDKVLSIEEKEGEIKQSFTEKVDKVVCHRIFGPIFLVLVLFAFYHVSVTYGNILAAKVWPIWAALEVFINSLMPHQGFLEDPLSTSLVEWVVKSMTSVLNYLPIFFLMFSFVSILESSGYLARIAFILDKIFHTYGLHGQSTLPLILGGVYVGGCAIPGIVATRAIPDERARFTTILIVPMMNCLAKVPLYLLMVSGFFAAEAGSTMFFMGTITLLMALIVAKLLNITFLSSRPTAPFIIELPTYHMPILRNVLQETFIRIWTFIKKILTVVMVVSTAVFILVTFPGLSEERQAFYEGEQAKVEDTFMAAVAKTSFAGEFTKDDILPLIRYQEELRAKKRGVTQEAATQINEDALKTSPIYASIVLRKGDDGKALATALRKVDTGRKTLRREMRQERFENSALGKAGKSLEWLTAGAGFNWRINIALLSALAAKENSAATLGALYGFEGTAVGANFEEFGFTPLHALSLMLFMALYPPCLAASMMVKGQTNSTGWMLFSIGFQMTIGLLVATLVFSGGTYLKLTGVQAMWTFYAICAFFVVVLGFIPNKKDKDLTPYTK